MSLGKANYCLRALIEKGFVQAENYRNSRHKMAYLYLLTPGGLTPKARLTRDFLERKLNEFEALRLEIANLRRESGNSSDDAEHVAANTGKSSRDVRATGLESAP